jgi:hypothetical protein
VIKMTEEKLWVEALRISENLSLPRDCVTWVFAYLAKRGAGKTYNASVQAEEMLKANIPIVVIDGMGIWWGLRVKNDGKSEGLPIVVFGGEHQDLPLVGEKAADMARAIVESNISCVLDLSGLSKYAARKIVADFLNELYKVNRVERHIFIEEADLWAPQRPIGNEEALCLSAVDNFVRRGGNHNLGVTLITQRSAVLNKDILTQSDCLVILRTLAPQDKKAIQAWVEEQTEQDKTELNKWYDSLKTLENGEAWVWHPEKPTIFCKVKYRQRETFHATREFIRSPLAAHIVLMDVGDFVSKFKSVFKEPQKLSTTITATADPKLKEEIAQTKAQLEKVTQERDAAHKRWQEITEEDAKLADELEAAHKELEATKALREALKALVGAPQQAIQVLPSTNGKTTLQMKEEALNVEVAHTERTVQVTTQNQQGQILFVAITDLPPEGFSESQMSDALKEHGWNISHGSLAPQLNVNLVKAGLLVKLDTKPARYRLPGKVKIKPLVVAE